MNRLVVAALAALFCMSACGGGGGPAGVVNQPGGQGGAGGGAGNPPPQNLRPANAPDYIVLSVSGRTIDLQDLFCPPECNVASLSEPGGAADAIVNALLALGFLAEQQGYIAAFESFDDDADGMADRHGFLDLVADLQQIHDEWIDGFDNPTRIVLVAHSHGSVWAHIAASVLPNVTIDVLVSLDGVCLQWETDHGDSITDYFAQNGNPFPWDISQACASWTIPGVVDPADTEDVVFDNIVVNLEVRSSGFLALAIQDEQLNYRLDGSRDGIETFDSIDDHTQVDEPGRESLDWVLARLAALTP